MNVTASLLELLKYTIPAIIVLAASYMIVQKFLVSATQRKQLALLQETQDTTLRLRLQAYERMVLFVERINPRLLIPRLYDSGMSAQELSFAIVYTIRTEFEHNMSQQIYLTKNAWETVRSVKEQEIMMVNNIAATLPPDASAKELNGKIMNYLLTVEGELPTDIALHVLNEEARRMMAVGGGTA